MTQVQNKKLNRRLFLKDYEIKKEIQDPKKKKIYFQMFKIYEKNVKDFEDRIGENFDICIDEIESTFDEYYGKANLIAENIRKNKDCKNELNELTEDFSNMTSEILRKRISSAFTHSNKVNARVAKECRDLYCRYFKNPIPTGNSANPSQAYKALRNMQNISSNWYKEQYHLMINCSKEYNDYIKIFFKEELNRLINVYYRPTKEKNEKIELPLLEVASIRNKFKSLNAREQAKIAKSLGFSTKFAKGSHMKAYAEGCKPIIMFAPGTKERGKGLQSKILKALYANAPLNKE